MTVAENQLRQALEDIAAERGKCGVCGRLAVMPSNIVICDDDRRCAWVPRDPVEVARAALGRSEAE